MFVVPVDAAVPPGLTVLAAGAGDQVSLGYSDKGHGLFTYFLLKRLREAAAGGDRLTYDALHIYLAGNVRTQARIQGRVQTPVLAGDRTGVVLENR